MIRIGKKQVTRFERMSWHEIGGDGWVGGYSQMLMVLLGSSWAPPPLPAGRPLASSSSSSRPAVTTSRSQRTLACTKSGLLHHHHTTRVYRSTQANGLHQWRTPVRGPQAAPNPTSGLTHHQGSPPRIPAGKTLEYALSTAHYMHWQCLGF